MRVVLYNNFHAGDVVMCRPIIGDIVQVNPDRGFELQCKSRYTYLWRDLGLPVTGLADGQDRIARGGPTINLYFATFGDSLSRGLTYANHVNTYNRQAKMKGLAPVVPNGEKRFISLPKPDLPTIPRPSVLVENGPVLSGQPVLNINPYIPKLADRYRGTTFYCSHSLPKTRLKNIVDVGDWDLQKLSALSERCVTMIARLSAVLVVSFTKANDGKRRIVFGKPLGCPIWDEDGIVYADTYDALTRRLNEVLL